VERGVREDVMPVVENQQLVIKKLLRMYRSDGDDLEWARSGVLATVVNGEAITVVQS